MYTDTADKLLLTSDRITALLTENGGMKRAAINALLGLPTYDKSGPTPPWRQKLQGTFIPRERYDLAMKINRPQQMKLQFA